VQTIEYSTVQ